MFGKKSKLTDTQKFVIAKGREVGNLKQAGAPFNKKAPMKAPIEAKVAKGRQTPNPFPNNSKSPGKVGTM